MVGQALSAANAPLNYAQQQAQFESAKDARRTHFIQESASARRALWGDYQALLTRRAQEFQASANDILNISRQADTARGLAAISAAKGGLAGTSVMEEQLEFEKTAIQREMIISQREAFYKDQLNRDLQGAHDRAYGRIYAAIGSPIAPPDILGTFITLGGSAANYFGNSSGSASPSDSGLGDTSDISAEADTGEQVLL